MITELKNKMTVNEKVVIQENINIRENITIQENVKAGGEQVKKSGMPHQQVQVQPQSYQQTFSTQQQFQPLQYQGQQYQGQQFQGQQFQPQQFQGQQYQVNVQGGNKISQLEDELRRSRVQEDQRIINSRTDLSKSQDLYSQQQFTQQQQGGQRFGAQSGNYGGYTEKKL